VRLARHRLPGSVCERGGEVEIERGRFGVVEWERRSGGYLCPRGRAGWRGGFGRWGWGRGGGED
jgi:hypothetical protein